MRASQFGLHADERNASSRCAGGSLRSTPASSSGYRPGSSTLHATWPLPARETPDAAARRARRLALTLVELGESVDAVQAQLGRWRFAPDVCRAAAIWADAERAARAARAAAGPDAA